MKLLCVFLGLSHASPARCVAAVHRVLLGHQGHSPDDLGDVVLSQQSSVVRLDQRSLHSQTSQQGRCVKLLLSKPSINALFLCLSSDDVVVALTNSGFVKVWTIATVTVKVCISCYCSTVLLTPHTKLCTFSRVSQSMRKKPNKFDV